MLKPQQTQTHPRFSKMPAVGFSPMKNIKKIEKDTPPFLFKLILCVWKKWGGTYFDLLRVFFPMKKPTAALLRFRGQVVVGGAE
jgi:hypothetical protein